VTVASVKKIADDRKRVGSARKRYGERVGPPGRKGPIGLGVHPGHDRAQPEAERHRQERQPRGRIGADEPAEQIVELWSPGWSG